MYNHFLQAMCHSCLGSILGDDLRSICSRFTRAAEIHFTRAGPRNSVTFRICNRDNRIVESRAHFGDARGNILTSLSLSDLELAYLLLE